MSKGPTAKQFWLGSPIAVIGTILLLFIVSTFAIHTFLPETYTSIQEWLKEVPVIGKILFP